MNIVELDSIEKRIELLKNTIETFASRADENDKTGRFPYENFEELKSIGYPALTLPEQYGGAAISLTEMLKYQELISRADGSTGLSVGWHMGIMKDMGEYGTWSEEKYAQVARDTSATGALLNNAATEPATGSPTRGGRPETTAVKNEQGWLINGRKSFTTLSPVLTYFVVSASVDGTENVADFLIKDDKNGLTIDETWDSIAMKGSGSHDIVMDDVQVDTEDLVVYRTGGHKRPAGWLLHIPACYLGIAKAARDEAVAFATQYSPNSIEGTISDLPNVKQKIGEIELTILEADHLLYSVSEKWDGTHEEVRLTMGPELGAVKLSVVNKAIEIVDLAMRIVGAKSLSEKSRLQRYYRDVRAGLHNPPMDDMTIIHLADQSISEFK